MEKEKTIDENFDIILAELNEDAFESGESIKMSLTTALATIKVEFSELPEDIGENLLNIGIVTQQANEK